MDSTTLGLKKPLATEAYDIQIFNDNADKTNELILADREQINSLVADYIRSPGYGVTTGSANIYALTLNPALAAYTAGVCVAVKINVANTGASTININGLGAKPIKDSKGNALASGKLALNSVYTFRYDDTNFILQGEGGEYGTATASDVLLGKTVGTDSGLVTGTILSKAAATITPSTIAQTIAAGQYLSGIQTIAGDADLLPENIKNGVNLFGIIGTASIPSGTAAAAQVLAGYTFSNANGVGIAGSMLNNGSQGGTITTQGGTKVIPAGYTTGGTVTASFANLTSEYVVQGVNIGGVVGTSIPLNTILSTSIAVGTGMNFAYGISQTVATGAYSDAKNVLFAAVVTNGLNSKLTVADFPIWQNISGSGVIERPVGYEIVIDASMEWNGSFYNFKGSRLLFTKANNGVCTIKPALKRS